MKFDVNSPVLFLITACVIAVVIAQSVFFLVRALRRAEELGIPAEKLKKIMRTSAIFTIAPAVSIVIGVITLSKDLGIPVPWLRLSVIGSLSYETIAASNAESAMGLRFGSGTPLTSSQFVTIVFVMTICILAGILLLAAIGGKLQHGMTAMKNKDRKWAATFSNALFIGMISAFVGYIFCDVGKLAQGQTYGLIPVFVFVISMGVMVLCGTLMKVYKWNWMGDYALPITLLVGMASAIPLTAWLG
ncbi:MAG: DUF5058 family protein [Lachnospiraceae bacterium]|nr:DUF5058 family protein [Lachnospiraceae bacterium]